MTFDEVLGEVLELLQREKRVFYRGLKRRFALDEYLEDLKEELIGAKRLAVDEDGRFLVWTGDPEAASSEVLRINPNFSLELWRQTVPVKDPAVLERWDAALHNAGLK